MREAMMTLTEIINNYGNTEISDTVVCWQAVARS